MYTHSRSVVAVASVLASTISTALAGFSASSQSNVAIYWGQGSGQETLGSYCSSNPAVNIIPIAFEISLSDPTSGLDFGNEGVSNVAADIISCQAAGKTILLSIGGATFTENSLTTSDLATTAAQKIWSLFGPGTGSTRPFGDAVVDGFDLDLETQGLDNIGVFVAALRSLMDADTSKTWMLTAAPQCVYPDVADHTFLQGQVAMDAVFVQFYNNPQCGVNNFVSSTNVGAFNMDTWDTWAKTVSKNPKVKVFVGVPASDTAAGSGFVDAPILAEIIAYAKTFDSFGGIMSWDMVRIVENTGYLTSISKALDLDVGVSVSSVLNIGLGGGDSSTSIATPTVAASVASISSASIVAVPTASQVASVSAVATEATTTSTTVETSYTATQTTLHTLILTTAHAVASQATASIIVYPTLPSSIIDTPTATTSTVLASASASTAKVAGSACSPEGTWLCVAGTSYQQCGSGTWSVVMQLAAGTSCKVGEGATINVYATKEKRSRHLHRHLRASI